MKILTLILSLMLVSCTPKPSAPTQDLLAPHPTALVDEALRLEVESRIRNHKSLVNETIHINTESHTVLLTGFVPSLTLRKLAEAQIQSIPQTHTINRLHIGTPPSTWNSLKDKWITTKIRSKLLSNGQLNPHHLKVVTEWGTVYLLGSLPAKQAQLAIQLARQTEGVNKVVSAIYLR